MKAALPAESVSNGHNYWSEKPVTMILNAVVLRGREMKTIVTARVHHTKSGSRNYASIWVHEAHGKRRSFAGHGHASGGGYHRVSAALESAIESAGIKLDTAIGGVGDDAMRDAITAICEALGYKNVHIVVN